MLVALFYYLSFLSLISLIPLGLTQQNIQGQDLSNYEVNISRNCFILPSSILIEKSISNGTCGSDYLIIRQKIIKQSDEDLCYNNDPLVRDVKIKFDENQLFFGLKNEIIYTYFAGDFQKGCNEDKNKFYTYSKKIGERISLSPKKLELKIKQLNATYTTTEQCIVYPERIIINPSDKSFNNTLLIRNKFNKDQEVDKIPCDPAEPWQKELNINLDQDQYFVGQKGQYIITTKTSPKGFSNTIWVYEASTGKKIFQTNYLERIENPFHLLSENDLLKLNYYQQIDLDCSILTNKGHECWEKSLSKMNFQIGKKIDFPDCSKILKSKRFKNNNKLKENPHSIQVFVSVKVQDIYQGKFSYLEKKTICLENFNH